MSGRWVSLAEIARTVPRGAASPDSVWSRVALRPLSIPLSAVALALGASANAVTYFGIVVCLAAAALMAAGGRAAVIAGAALFNLFAVLDCVDGNVARVRGGSAYGPWVDALGGYVAYTAVLLAAGAAAGAPLAGGVAAACNLLMRVAHQSFRNIRPGGRRCRTAARLAGEACQREPRHHGAADARGARGRDRGRAAVGGAAVRGVLRRRLRRCPGQARGKGRAQVRIAPLCARRTSRRTRPPRTPRGRPGSTAAARL